MQTCLFSWCSSHRRSLHLWLVLIRIDTIFYLMQASSYDVYFQLFQFMLNCFKYYWGHKSFFYYIHYYGYVLSDKMKLFSTGTPNVFGVFVSVAVKTWRATVLIHPTAACVFVKTGTSALWRDAWWEWCRWMARSQSQKKASWNVISSYAISATGWL